MQKTELSRGGSHDCREKYILLDDKRYRASCFNGELNHKNNSIKKLKNTMKLKLVYITTALFILTSNEIIHAQIFEKPEIGAHLILQLESFDGDEMAPFAGYETPVSRFSIRHASIEASGKAGNKFEYNVEAGTATCLAGGQFTLMDASLFY